MDSNLFFIFFVTVFLLCKTFLALANTFSVEKGKDMSNKGGLSVIASIALGWILVQTATGFNHKEFILGLLPFIFAAVALSMYSIKRGNLPRFWIYLFTSAISVCFFPTDWLVFQGIFPLFFDRCFTALLWASFISVYARMDKVDNLTQTQTTALCLVFSLFPMLTRKVLPFSLLYMETFSYYPMIILAALIAFITSKKRNSDLLLGKTGAVPLGYLMGLFFIFLAVKGFYMAALVMPAYYYFELIYSSIYRLINRKNPQPVAFSFFINRPARNLLNTKKIMSLLLLMMIGFAFIGILFNNDYKIMLIMTAGIFIYIIYRILHWGQPKITYRSMFADTKEAICLLGSNVKENYKTASDFWKSKKK